MQKMSSDPTRLSLHGPTMATRWSVLCDVAASIDRAALHQALAAAVEQVDQQMSPWKADSDLMRLNRAAPGEWVSLPPEIMAVLARALEIARLSDGAFDPTVGALVNAWGFGAEREDPDVAAIRVAAQAGQRPAHQRLDLDPAASRARKHAPLQVDLCGIAKGYGVDRMVAVLQHHGVAHALVALDGELRALGTQAGGQPWAVAVESPEPGRRAARGVLELADVAVATSGDYRRWVDIGGARLSHTMDGRRAAPVNNGVASVTVLAPDCMSADAWATALLVAGPGEGLALAQRMGLEALFLVRQETRWVEMGLGRFAQADAR
ncbi:FAD:protein FMN transferase [Ottowia testudinis]|uniref:FAD:protein FMN transferase n=1 Tax=Ottowia testudinis TaxID=2816950 RepID=A0A975CKY8_9BURK|nr:FAD:protein FMN transferase [Ottowia testudinis]QTD46991.1 FAD:protein FMN transferase [Ottowia testudinis]